MYTEGSIVKIKPFEDLPEGVSKGFGKYANKTATVVGAYMRDDGTRCYQLRMDGCSAVSRNMFTEDMLLEPTAGLRIEFDVIHGKSIKAMLYDGDNLVEAGDAFIYHNDHEGFAQAASYAMKRLWTKLYDERTDTTNASLRTV